MSRCCLVQRLSFAAVVLLIMQLASCRQQNEPEKVVETVLELPVEFESIQASLEYLPYWDDKILLAEELCKFASVAHYLQSQDATTLKEQLNSYMDRKQERATQNVFLLLRFMYDAAEKVVPENGAEITFGGPNDTVYEQVFDVSSEIEDCPLVCRLSWPLVFKSDMVKILSTAYPVNDGPFGGPHWGFWVPMYKFDEEFDFFEQNFTHRNLNRHICLEKE